MQPLLPLMLEEDEAELPDCWPPPLLPQRPQVEAQ